MQNRCKYNTEDKKKSQKKSKKKQTFERINKNHFACVEYNFHHMQTKKFINYQ